MKNLLLLPLLAALTLLPTSCANRQPAVPGDEIIYGSSGVRFQSQDTLHFMPARAAY